MNPLVVALALAQPPAPQYHELDGLTPAEIGDLLLAGEPHGKIVFAEKHDSIMMPQGVKELALEEMPQSLGTGCTRRRWSVTFAPRVEAEETESTPVLFRRRGYEQVALSEGEPCLFATFVDRSDDLTDREAIDRLERASNVLNNLDAIEIVCRDFSDTDFCGDEERIKTRIRTRLTWIGGSDDRWTARIGSRTPFANITLIGLDVKPGTLYIRHRIPPPF